MNKRERILELVSEGVLSVEEGLSLLESLSKKEAKQTEEKEFTADEPKEKAVETEYEEEVKAESDEVQEDIQEDIEKELEQLANEINQYSVGIDLLNKDLTQLKVELAEIEDELNQRLAARNQFASQGKTTLENQIVNLNREIELVSLLDEVNNEAELQALNQKLTEALEELHALETTDSTKDEEIKELKNKASALKLKIEEMTEEKNQRMKEMHSLKMRRWTNKAKQMTEKIELPKDWREGASKTIDKAGEIIDDSSRTLGDLMRQTIRKTKETIEDIDWQDLKVDLPSREQVSFEHDWLFEETTASIVDFKNANGDIVFKPSINDNIKISAKIKLYGKMDETSPLAAFEARTIIHIDEDHFTFHIPNKNIKADLTVYLPERDYDYVRLNSFNGNVQFEGLLARDVYVKNMNGDVTFNQLEASMLEVKATNGNLVLKDTQLRDLLLSTVNGDIRVVGYAQSLDTSTVNGEVRLTLSGYDLIRATASSVKGDVKISLPKELSLEIEAKTTLGKVKSRLSETELLQDPIQKSKTHRFQRIKEGEIYRVNVHTTTGNILFKDTDQL